MLLGFDSFVNRVIKVSGEKCKSVVYATYSDNIIMLAILVAFYTSFTMNMLFYSNFGVFFLVLYILVMVFILFMILSRKIVFKLCIFAL